MSQSQFWDGIRRMDGWERLDGWSGDTRVMQKILKIDIDCGKLLNHWTCRRLRAAAVGELLTAARLFIDPLLTGPWTPTTRYIYWSLRPLPGPDLWSISPGPDETRCTVLPCHYSKYNPMRFLSYRVTAPGFTDHVNLMLTIPRVAYQ